MLQVLKSPIRVAVKKIHVVDKGEFDRELRTLRRIRQLKEPHLISLLAAYKFKDERHLVFPLASGGNLRRFWERQDGAQRTPKLVYWSLQQMCGLATAVHALHNLYDRLKEEDAHGGCRHGDLKPDNILLFDHDDEFNPPCAAGRLVIADLGIAKIHEKVTGDRGEEATTMRATTLAYEAPEAHPKSDRYKLPRSRKYDVWSLGCVLLEFAIWLLYGLDAVDAFAGHRNTKADENTVECPGVFYSIGISNGRPSVRSQVIREMDALLRDPRCGEQTALGALVTVIRAKVLIGDTDGRCTADVLKGDLKEILDKCGGCGDVLESGYLLKSVDGAMDDVFTC